MLLAGLFFRGLGQSDWTLKDNKDGIAIYMKTFPDSKFKGIKVECELDATLPQLVAVLMDVNTGSEWVYATKSCVLLKRVSPTELYYYSEVRVPWPASNRDFIAQLKVLQDTHTRVVTILGPTFPKYMPDKKDIVRVPFADGKWVITPVGAHTMKVEYTLRCDPGGDIPAWLVNMFAAKGPYESFKGLKAQLKKAKYQGVKLPFLVE